MAVLSKASCRGSAIDHREDRDSSRRRLAVVLSVSRHARFRSLGCVLSSAVPSQLGSPLTACLSAVPHLESGVICQGLACWQSGRSAVSRESLVSRLEAGTRVLELVPPEAGLRTASSPLECDLGSRSGGRAGLESRLRGLFCTSAVPPPAGNDAGSEAPRRGSPPLSATPL